MTTALCGKSALEYWRTPPLVRALALHPDNPSDDFDLPLSREELRGLRNDTFFELEIWRNDSVLSARGRPLMSDSSLDVLDSIALISPGISAPIEILVSSREDRRRSSLIRPSVMSDDLSAPELSIISKHLYVTSPALTLLTLAPRISLARLVMIASELCGSFSIYRTPPSLAHALEDLHANHLLPKVSSWSPSFDSSGHLTDLWSRPPLTSPEKIAALAARARGRRGRRALEQAAELVVANAASPFEVQAGVLLGFPYGLGGEGYAGFSHNHEVALSDAARRLAGRRTCRCDLFWPASQGFRAVDLECQSRIYHTGEERGLSDANRSTALQSMDIEVILATYAQFEDVRRFDALSLTIAQKIGRRPPIHTRGFLDSRTELRSQVLVSWGDLLSDLS